MSQKTSAEIRQDFLDFFAEKDHAIVPSAPVVPKDDPTLLFTNAGMNQFKPIFLGEEKALKHEGKWWSRAADTQKCIRVSGKHNDLEEVGHDTYHHTLFEMLGNWSFGDYFKKEAIGWAWELLVERWGLPGNRLYATVFEGDSNDELPADEEAVEYWKSETTINHDHILLFDKKDNFWEMGDTGPCGPCSEVHIDLRSENERKKKDGLELVNKDHPLVVEIWNLVFIQFNRQAGGALESLPAKHIDTGMGFERICMALQDKTSNYDTDIFTPLIQTISDMAGITYGEQEDKDIAVRVIADHIRAVTFSIADGASPGNDGRGYVIRRILRRAVRYGWDKLDFKESFFFKLVDVLTEQFEEVFPEIKAQQQYIKNVIKSEEKSFLNTLGQGIELFREMSKERKEISGEDAFKLHDTYGFPIDLTQLMAREKGIAVDEEGFNRLMKEQKERARAAGKFKADQSNSGGWTIISDNGEFKFIGYDHLQAEVQVTGFKKAEEHNTLLLDRSPFYAESGGQVADTGVLEKDDMRIRVLDVQKSPQGFVHYVDHIPDHPEKTLKGIWHANVDREKRIETQKHHTATHLVHAALREILGDHVAQKGSLVDEHHLRFDFSHYEAVTAQQLDEIEALVNHKIQENILLFEERNIPIEEAKKRGAMMLFGEKYGEFVRVITFDEDFSVELCGGTHVQATGEIGYFRFLGESSAAAGIRRIEAAAGKRVDELLRREKHILDQAKHTLGQGEDLAAEIEKLMEEKKALQKELDQMLKQQSGQAFRELMEHPEIIGEDIKLIKGEINNADMDTLKQLGYDVLNQRKEKTITVLGSKDEDEGKVYLMAAVTDDLINEGLQAGTLVGQLGRLVGGGGGGQPDLATAGGRSPEKLDEALDKVNKIINEIIG